MASSGQVVTLKCSVCDDNIAIVYCYECEHYLCQHCQHFHQKFPATKLHTLTNAHQVDKNALKNKVICSEHSREYAFICQTCKALICSVCVINKHHGHEFKGIAETATEARIATKRKVVIFKDQVNKIENLINESKSTERNKIRVDSENYKAKVQEIATDFIKIVETGSKMYITKASDFHDLESQKLQENVKILQTLSDEQTSQYRKIEDILTIEHDTVFYLNISEENITSELEEIPSMEDTRSMEDFDTEEFIKAILEQIKIKYNPKCLDSRQSEIDRLLEIQQSKETELIALSRAHEIEVTKLKRSIDDANIKLSMERTKSIEPMIKGRKAPVPPSKFYSSNTAIARNSDSEFQCCICLDGITNPKTLPCSHVFCKECIDHHFTYKPSCPICGLIFVHGKLFGNQPDGRMTVRTRKVSLPGYPGTDTIEIEYMIYPGTQGVRERTKSIEPMIKGRKAPVPPSKFYSSNTAIARNSDSEFQCCICLDGITNPKTLPCSHVFCKECIDHHFTYKPSCPICGLIFVHGKLFGNQPDGRMTVRTRKVSLPGYPGTDTIEIEYMIYPGTQGDEHPNPGRYFESITRLAYLPDTKKGRLIAKLLKVAFNRKLTFTITCTTTWRTGVVTWNNIHHKTTLEPNTQFGYPDEGYFDRVLEELAVKGITEKDLQD